MMLFVIAFTVLSIRLSEAHSIANESTTDESSPLKEESIEITELHAPRGRILDRNEEVLALSSPHYDLVADRYLLVDVGQAATAIANDMLSCDPKWESWANEKKSGKIKLEAMRLRKTFSEGALIHQHLAQAFGLLSTVLKTSPQELEKVFLDKQCSKPNVVVASELDNSQKDAIEAMIIDKRIRGFKIVQTYKRSYPGGSKACHLIGFANWQDEKLDVNKDVKASPKQKGIKGIEATYEEKLSGQDGFKKVWLNRQGIVDYTKRLPEIIEAIPGNDVCLTLDSHIQQIVEEELRKCVSIYNPQNAAAIVMDPQSGDVLASVSYPQFNLNSKKAIQFPPENSKQSKDFNYDFAKRGAYEPGSTFKAVTFAAAFNDKKLKSDEMINCGDGEYTYENHTYTESHHYGLLPANLVLGKSSNIGTFKVALRLGKDRYVEYINRFGFEYKMNVKSNISFFPLTYGYSILVSPLQIASFYSMIANDGVLMQPRYVMREITPKNEMIDCPTVSKGQVISSEAARMTRDALKTVVSDGTGTKADVEGFTVAGKTGTTKIWDSNLWNPKTRKKGDYSELQCGSFAGMMPADEARFVCVVVVRAPIAPRSGPNNKLNGGDVAAPVFAEIAKKLAVYMNIKPSLVGDKKVKKQP